VKHKVLVSLINPYMNTLAFYPLLPLLAKESMDLSDGWALKEEDGVL
jgi:hypothetical protein